MSFSHIFWSWLQIAGEYSPEQYARNFQFLFYGLLAAWLILCAYVVSLVARERKIKRQLESLRQIVEHREDPDKK